MNRRLDRRCTYLLLAFAFACAGDKPGDVGEVVESGGETGLPLDTSPVFGDVDGDGYLSDDDCDDTNADVNPAAEEICDGIDNDCNDLIDEDDPYLDRDTMSQYYYDADGDDYGTTDAIAKACSAPEGFGSNEGDCDDTDSAVNPGATEICDDLDNDCNGSVDDSATEGDWFYPDEDGDGIGVIGDLVLACNGATLPYDCDDDDATEPQVVDASSSGLTAGTLAFPWYDIQTGIDNADKCVIVFGGTYTEAIDFSGKDLSVVGVEGAETTVIDATGLGAPAVTFAAAESSAATLSGFTITGGQGAATSSTYTWSCGSGITCNEYTTSYCGGAIYVSGASPTLSDLILDTNVLTEASTTSSGNDTWYVASFGGAICLLDGAVSLTDTVMRSNYADLGGALYLDENSQVDASRTWILQNTATDGAAIAVDGGALTLENVVSAWNEASGEGGGAWLENGSLSADQVTWGEDDAPTGGILSAAGTGALSLRNSILFGANVGTCVTLADGASLSASYGNMDDCGGGRVSGGTDPTGSSGNITSDPLFTSVTDDGDPDNDDWTLRSASPSVDAGDPSTTDADGSRADQGAFGGAGSDWE